MLLYSLGHIRQRDTFELSLWSDADPAPFSELQREWQILQTHPAGQGHILLARRHLLQWRHGTLGHQPGGIGTAVQLRLSVDGPGKESPCLQQIIRQHQRRLLASHCFQGPAGREA